MEPAVFSRQPSRATGRSSASMDSQGLLASGDMRLHALLAQQLQAAEDVIEFHKAITRSLDTYKLLGTSRTSNCVPPFTPGELLIKTPRLKPAKVGQSSDSIAHFGKNNEVVVDVGQSSDWIAPFSKSKELAAHVGQSADAIAPFGQSEESIVHVGQSTNSIAHFGPSEDSIAPFTKSKELVAHVGQTADLIAPFGQSDESIVHVGQSTDSTAHFGQSEDPIVHVDQSTDSTTLSGRNAVSKDRCSRKNHSLSRNSDIQKPLLADAPDETAIASQSMHLWQSLSTSAKSFLSIGDECSIAPYRTRKRRLVMAASNKAKDGLVATTSDYNIEDLYFEEGRAQAIARSAMFQNATQLIIIVYALWMGIDTDWNHAQVLCEASLIFQIMENLFCAYFCFEIAVRFFAFERKVYAARDFWFVSDAILVLLTIWETWIQTAMYLISGSNQTNGSRGVSVLRLFRALRLVRISRFARILRMMPELFILIKSIGTAMRCMAVTLFMLVMVIYIFSIIFVQLMAGTPTGKGHFDNVPQAMNFMLTSVLCGFDADFINLLLADSFLYYILWLFYVLLGSLSIMNVLIGILCEVVSGTADEEKEIALKNDVMIRIIRALGFNPKVPIGKEEMVETLDHSDVCGTLEAMGIDVDALLDFVQFFEDNTEMYLDDFVDVIVCFRGCKPTNVNDILNMRKFITMEVHDLGGVMKTKKARVESATAN